MDKLKINVTRSRWHICKGSYVAQLDREGEGVRKRPKILLEKEEKEGNKGSGWDGFFFK